MYPILTYLISLPAISAQLLPALDLTSARELEDLIIEALYSDLLKARINQKRQLLEVDSVVGRDVKPVNSSAVPFGQGNTVDTLVQALSIWYDRVGSTLGELDYHIQGIKQKEYAIGDIHAMVRL